MSKDTCILTIHWGERKKPDWFPIDVALAIEKRGRTVLKPEHLPEELILFAGPTRESKKKLVVKGKFGKPTMSKNATATLNVLLVGFALIGFAHVVTSVGYALAQ